jgi:hypothetical protein
LTVASGQEDAWLAVAKLLSLLIVRRRGIIARGAMIPVVGSYTEGSAIRVSVSRVTPE